LKAIVCDSNVLLSVGPMEVAAYLRSHSWRQERLLGDRGTVWTAPSDHGDRYEILLPLDHSVADYAYRMADVLQTLAAAEARSQLQILSDLTQITSDVVRIGVRDTAGEDETVPLEDGVRMVQAARDLMMAAACAAVQPRAVYSSRRFAQAGEYASRLRLAQTEPEGFTLVIRSAVPPHLRVESEMQTLSPQEPHLDQPFERRVALTLAGALAAAREAVAQAGATGDLSPFTQAIGSGVSADLCEALAALSLDGAAFDVSIAISWSPTRAVPANTPDRFQFVSGAMPLLREAARLLAKEGKSSGSASWANLR